jgi:hypothetical protein
MLALLAQATTQPAPPQSWTEPAILPFVLTSILAFVGGCAAIVVWVHGKLKAVEQRQDRQSQRIDSALLNATPPQERTIVVGGVPAPTTLPRHSTET